MSVATLSATKVSVFMFMISDHESNVLTIAGDRTKHLKNLHGVTKAAASGSLRTCSSLNSTEDSSSSSILNMNEETTSSISSYHSISDAGSLATSFTSSVESPVKTEPLPNISLQDIRSLDLLQPQPMSSGPSASTSSTHSDDTSPAMSFQLTDPPHQETVTMSLDEVMQFAQPIVTDL